jgi:hypothetical protein
LEAPCPDEALNIKVKTNITPQNPCDGNFGALFIRSKNKER